MATVDITELIPNIEAWLTIPGSDSPYADATDEEWTLKLVNAFWQAVLDGNIENYTIDEDGLISPIDGGDSTFEREYQQLVVIYAAMNVVNAQLLANPTSFRAQAGPVEYESETAASVLTTLMADLRMQKELILNRLSDLGLNTSSFYYDGTFQRRENQEFSDQYWTGY